MSFSNSPHYDYLNNFNRIKQGEIENGDTED